MATSPIQGVRESQLPRLPLRTAVTVAANNNSSSSNSFSGKSLSNATTTVVKFNGGGRLSHFGELSDELSGSSDGSPKARLGHGRSGSGQLVFSGTMSTGGNAAWYAGRAVGA